MEEERCSSGSDAAELAGWLPDSASSKCMICYRQFGFPVRRHHCRFCGKLVCGPCSRKKRIALSKPEAGALRCCDVCYSRLQQSDGEPDFLAAAREVAVVLENQRWAFSWGASHLLPLDPMRYAGLGETWRHFPHAAAAPEGGQWVGEWRIDTNGEVDDRGWCYAFDFPEFSFKGAYGLQTTHTYVRRRRWIREWVTSDRMVPSSRPASLFEDPQKKKKNLDVDTSLLVGRPTAKSADLEDVRMRVAVIEDDEERDDTAAAAALGRIYVRPLAIALPEGGDDERDVYVRARCRSPKLAGAGWVATAWQSTRVVHQTNTPTRKLSGGALCVAIANPRSVVDLHVCCADTDASLAQCELGAFEIDAALERDVVARAVDNVYPRVGRWVFGNDDDDDDLFRHDPKLRDWPPRNARTGSPPPSPPHRKYWPLYKQQRPATAPTRAALPMFPANPAELSTSAIRELVDRVSNLVEPLIAAVKILRSCISWTDEPRRTALTLASLLLVEYFLDATRVLSVFPLAVVALLLYTLHRRCSGAWARAWIERGSEKEFIPCVGIPKKPKQTNTSSNTFSRRASFKRLKAQRSSKEEDEPDETPQDTTTTNNTFEQQPPPPPPPGCSRRAASSRHRRRRRRFSGGCGRRPTPATAATTTASAHELEVLTAKIAVRDVRGLVAVDHVRVELALDAAIRRRKQRLGSSFADDARGFKRDFPTDIDDLYNNPWLRRCKQVKVRRSVHSEFEDEAIDERVDAAIQDYVVPWTLDDGSELTDCARYPVVAPVEGARAALATERFVFRLYAPAATDSSRRRRHLFAPRGNDGDDLGFVGECSIPLSRLVGTRKDERRGGSQPMVETWLPIRADDDAASDDDGPDDDDAPALLVATQLVLPTSSQRRKDTTDADRAELAMLSRAAREAEAEPDDAKLRRGPIAEFQAARTQVLELIAEAIRYVSFAESCVNLVCWVQPVKTALVLGGAASAAAATMVVPFNFVLMACTCAFFYDEYVKASNLHNSSVVDERLNNFVRSIPDAADLAAYFAPRTRLWLDTTAGTSSRVQLQRHMAPFAGVCWKTSGVLSKTWQRRYIVIDDDRRLLWWVRAEDAQQAPKGLRYLASGQTQAKLKANAAVKAAPRGYLSSDLVVPYASSEIPGGLVVTHYLCAMNPDDAQRLRRTIYGLPTRRRTRRRR
ncbi:hypothetical protein CTAYLR_007874 [Chrysophaeum taylorii]|uniref:FYVE-type domain-containing protein n=1 Tax=Chrysophaeum taylorii TaxID=2483200 RepID=A0AAD7XL92_9STRA|nr:hypothetical protein CTAYLR_007874 [Chrysophaeum taylorii]